MDRLLFNSYLFDISADGRIDDDEVINVLTNLILGNAQYKIKYGNKDYYNFFPQEERNIQLILDTTRYSD